MGEKKGGTIHSAFDIPYSVFFIRVLRECSGHLLIRQGETPLIVPQSP